MNFRKIAAVLLVFYLGCAVGYVYSDLTMDVGEDATGTVYEVAFRSDQG